MTRRSLLLAALAPDPNPGFRFVDVTAAAGLQFRHNTGAFGQKYLPETMGAGCAFLDYDNDGWQDILLINGADFAGHKKQRTTLHLYRNNRNGTFTDVTRQAGLDVELYGLGVAVADYNNDGFEDIYVTTVGQNRLFQNNGKGGFVDVTAKCGLSGRQAFSTSALWFDFDRDGWLDLFVCNYVRWSPELDVRCSLDGKTKSYCTPEAYRGSTCWLFRNRGDGTFEDVTAKAGVFDSTSKSLGVAMFDYDRDGWPDIVVANDTQPNKLYRNRRDGTFTEVGVKSGLAFSEDGKARAGMGVDAAVLDEAGYPTVAITNFQHEMLGLYRGGPGGVFTDVAPNSSVGAGTRGTLGFGCLFFDPNLDGWLDLAVINGHIDESISRVRPEVRYPQPPQLFLNTQDGFSHDISHAAGGFDRPIVGRGAAYGDFDNDGDQDLLVTSNGGAPTLFRNDTTSGNKSLRLKLTGTKSNRDAIGATVQFECGGRVGHRMVKSGSSYLSQSELPLTLGLGPRHSAGRLVVNWPSGKTEEFKNIAYGSVEIIEGQGLKRF